MTPIKIILFFLLVQTIGPTRAMAAAPEKQELTISRIYSSPELDGSLIMGLKFSPRGQRLSFLRPKLENFEVLDLWEFDLKTGQPRSLIDANSLKFEKLSEEEKARRERLRINRKGIVEYHWFHDGERIALPVGGDLYLYSFLTKKLQRLTQDDASEMDVKVSPLDRYISFTRDQNLFLLNTESFKITPVTTDGKDTVSNGIAEFVAQEEMGRSVGYWWSKDEQYIAFTRVDESAVKMVDRYDIDADKVVVRKQRYPEAGSANVTIQLGVVKVADLLEGHTEPQWVKLGKNKDLYLTNAAWNSDGKLIFQIQSRDQKKLEVFAYDPVAKKERRLFVETDSKWVNLNSDFKMLEKSSRWIWASERTGFKHLYLYKNNGTELYPLTKGNWVVNYLIGVDEIGGWVYFTANKDNPLVRHVYRVSLEKPGPPELLTRDEGWNNAAMSERADVFVHFFSAPMTPPQVHLKKGNGEVISTLSANELKEGHPLFPFKDTLVAPEFGSFKASTGETLYYRLYKPMNFDSAKKYPLVVIGYGGPGVQFVTQSWTGKAGLLAQVFLNRGFLVASFDNRGSANRGKKFENYLYRGFGTVEVADQVAGVKHLIAKGFIDSERIGFSGWSYGGFLSMSLAAKAPGVFKAHVASAPVGDFSFYDTHYTERYLGNPGHEKTAYAQAAILPHVQKITGDVLILHGMADDNVLFLNSTMLFKEMQKAGKLYESVTYPGAKHGISGRDNQIHVQSTILDFFERRLRSVTKNRGPTD